MSTSIGLLNNGIRVSTPYIKVTIGDYIFGVFKTEKGVSKDSNGTYKYLGIQYPNYIQSLNVTKINGTVNSYSLNITYPLTENSDPNFFEKVFSSVSNSRKIVFSYGDLSAPTFLYKNEEAFITAVNNSFNLDNGSISYTVTAVSSGLLNSGSTYNFVNGYFTGRHKPSDVIKYLLRHNSTYGLLDVFTGMRNLNLIIQKGYLASDDDTVNLDAKTNISVLDYLKYLVSCMKKENDSSWYTFVVVDDTSDTFGGPYFKIINTKQSMQSLDTYELTIGYPSNTLVKSFTINDNQNYSILYNYSNKLNTNEYVTRINDDGDYDSIYSPNITTKSESQIAESNNLNWWKNVTQYNISATLKIQGLLRPAILMQKLKLNVLFFGKAHITSGTYVITKQVDDISTSGCRTTLSLTKISSDTDNYQEVV